MPSITDAALAYYQDVYRFAYSLCFKEADALDLTQTAFMKISKHGHTILDQGKVRSWLFTTVHREFLHQRRHVVRFPHSSLDETEAQNMPAPEKSERSQDSSDVMQALEQMEENLRAPLTLYYLKDMRYREIAEVLSLPIGTVMSRLSRAKKALRESLGMDDSALTELPSPI